MAAVLFVATNIAGNKLAEVDGAEGKICEAIAAEQMN
jgi:hypothetical protein